MKPSERSEAKGVQEGCAMTDYRAGRLRPKAGKNHDRLWSEAEYPKGGRLAAYAMEARNGIGRDAPRPGVCFFIPPTGRQPTFFSRVTPTLPTPLLATRTPKDFHPHPERSFIEAKVQVGEKISKRCSGLTAYKKLLHE